MYWQNTYDLEGLEIERTAMLEKQKRLFNRLGKDFYSRKEIMETLNMPYEETIELTKDIKRTEKGFNRIDIVIALMGGVLYGN